MSRPGLRRAALAAAALLAAGRSASLSLDATTPAYTYTGTSNSGPGAFAATADGGLVSAAYSSATCGNDILVTWFKTGLAVRSELVYDNACVAQTPYGIVVDASNQAYICGSHNAFGGFLMSVDVNRTVRYYFSDITFVDSLGYRDIALDPADGTLWVVGTGGGAPQHAAVVHYKATGERIGAFNVPAPSGGDPSIGYTIAVDADHVYVGGYVNHLAADHAWVAALGRDGTVVYSAVDSAAGTYLSRVRVGAAGLFGVYAKNAGGGMNFFAAALDRSSGSIQATDGPLYSSACAPPCPWPYPGGMALHPSLPFMAVTTQTGFQAYRVDGGSLTRAGTSANLVGTNGTPNAIGISEGLDFMVATATQSVTPPQQLYEQAQYVKSDFTGQTGKSNLLAAPNRLDWGTAGSFIRFVAKNRTSASSVVRIYSFAGVFVASLNLTTTSNNEAELIWNGKLSDGTPVGAGAYVAMLDGGAKADRAPFVVTLPKGK